MIRGISIGTALTRSGNIANFTILSSSPFGRLADDLNINHIEIPTESEDQLSRENFQDSILYKTMITLNPDILLIDLLWFPLYNFIDQIPGKKIFLWQRMAENYFSMDLPSGKITYKPEQFDLVLAMEPFLGGGPDQQINPLILRNGNEILSRKEAIRELSLGNKKNCLLAYNGHPGDFERVKKEYSYLEKEGYNIVATTNYKGGIFPVIDYFNAFDLIVCGASYNSFWEVIYFKKKGIFVPTKTRFVDGERLIRQFSNYSFKENGADQLVKIMMDM
ncbi:MAG: hypothetical protein KAH95_03450 [Spirochaetales bacterium]|nr:hypothetical protein [Spirochaetales bacterium]